MKEEELLAQLRKMEEERSDLEDYVHRFQKQDEEEEEGNDRSYLDAEQMRESCSSEDYEILQLLCEKQELLGSMKRKREESRREVQQAMKKKYMELEMREEDIQFQIQKLHDEEEKEKE